MPTKPAMKKILNQPSWKIASDTTEAYVTELGGHIGPITFKLGNKKIAPFSVAPWAQEKLPADAPSMLRALRGDFFCMPFGGNPKPYRGEKHPYHGQTANEKWQLENYLSAGGMTTLHVSLETTIRKGHVDKIVTLRDGHAAVYQEHAIWGMKGPMTMGHHAMLKFPDTPGSGLIATSPMIYGQVFPQEFEQPQLRGYQSLKMGAEFTSLEEVPTIFGDAADVSRYPARRGFEDILIMVNDPKVALAWTAVTFPKEKFVFFALKDPAILPVSMMWISNGGRHYAPWNSRHINVMGLEEICSYFFLGLPGSIAKNPVSDRGIKTFHTLDPQQPFHVPYIMAVAKIPPGFDKVKSIEQTENGAVLISQSGKSAKAPLDFTFLSPQA